jgi:hypothetical protein
MGFKVNRRYSAEPEMQPESKLQIPPPPTFQHSIVQVPPPMVQSADCHMQNSEQESGGTCASLDVRPAL